MPLQDKVFRILFLAWYFSLRCCTSALLVPFQDTTTPRYRWLATQSVLTLEMKLRQGCVAGLCHGFGLVLPYGEPNYITFVCKDVEWVSHSGDGNLISSLQDYVVCRADVCVLAGYGSVANTFINTLKSVGLITFPCCVPFTTAWHCDTWPWKMTWASLSVRCCWIQVSSLPLTLNLVSSSSTGAGNLRPAKA